MLIPVAVEELPVFGKAKDFIAGLRPSNDELWGDEDPTQTGWVFRGQARAIWRLRPAAYRHVHRNRLLAAYLRLFKQRYIGRWGFTPEDWLAWVRPGLTRPANVEETTWRCRVARSSLDALTHAAIVRDFVLLADRTGHRTIRPDFLWHLENREDQAHHFGQFFRGKVHQDDMVAFAIAQHHRVPTGLLDWTYNPLVAAFFAAEELAHEDKRTPGERIAVWAIRTQIFKRDYRELRRLTVPPGKVPFLDAQDGLFIWSPIAYEWFLLNGRYPTLEQLVHQIAASAASSGLKGPLLRKLTLPVEEVPALLKCLWREEVTRAHLMPTYDNVTASMELKALWFEDIVSA